MTKAEVQATIKHLNAALEQGRRAERIAAWRGQHPDATCSDHVAGLLADLEATFARRPEAT